jgi:putative intracellular protease/amidase
MAEAFAEAYRSMRGDFSKTVDWGVHVVRDGLLTAGQNPASSGPAAKGLLERLAKLGKC